MAYGVNTINIARALAIKDSLVNLPKFNAHVKDKLKKTLTTCRISTILNMVPTPQIWKRALPTSVSPHTSLEEMIAALARTPAVISFCKSDISNRKYQRSKCRTEKDQHM